jgi:hypothetical protein
MADERPKTSAKPCAACGAKNFSLTFVESTRAKMEARCLCFSCNHWTDRLGNVDTIIDGHTYGPGSRTSGSLRGMAGRRFDIEYFDGRRITTYDLWSGGAIPAHFKDKFPDNARFLNGGERADLKGHIETCWNPSDDSTPPYPLPNGSRAPWSPPLRAVLPIIQQFAAAFAA